jgi:hypothetical protein
VLPLAAYFFRFSLLHVYFVQADDYYRLASKVDAGSSHQEKLSQFLYRSACDGSPHVKLLLKAGVPGSNDNIGSRLESELHCAVGKGHVETAALLLGKGAGMNGFSNHAKLSEIEITPLYAAVLGRNRPMVELLLRHGANPSRSVPDGHGLPYATVLHGAAGQGDLGLFALLVKAGAVPAQTVLHTYVVQVLGSQGGTPNWKAVLDEAVAAGMPLKGKDEQGRSLLHLAAALGQFELIDVLLERGFERLAPDRYGVQPYMYLAHWYGNSVGVNPGAELENTMLVLSLDTPDLNVQAATPVSPASWLAPMPPPEWSIAHAAVPKRRLRKLFAEQLDYSKVSEEAYASDKLLASHDSAQDLVIDLSIAQLRATPALALALERRGWTDLARLAQR